MKKHADSAPTACFYFYIFMLTVIEKCAIIPVVSSDTRREPYGGGCFP